MVRSARGFGAVLILVRIVQTIIVTVTHPRLRNTPLIVARKVPNIWTRLHQTSKISFDPVNRHSKSKSKYTSPELGVPSLD